MNKQIITKVDIKNKTCFLCENPATTVFEAYTGRNYYLCTYDHMIMLGAEIGTVQVSRDGRSIIL